MAALFLHQVDAGCGFAFFDVLALPAFHEARRSIT